ncbi:MAG: helix-turn-helix transcriptional regulator [Actinomycetota bacterium]
MSVVPRHERSKDIEIAAAFGAQVRAQRLAKGMTQEALAEAADLHPTFISNVERGYRVPTVPTLIRLSIGLGISPGQLVDGVVDQG